MINVIRELTTLSIFARVVLAIIIGGMLGSGRERLNRPAGLRTYMLVCLGSAVCMMINQYVAQAYGSGDPVRIGAQVISGIGFLGAGSIIMTGRNRVSGLTTAAGLWASAGLGLAIGIGLYELAIIGSMSTFFVLTILQCIEPIFQKRRKMIDVYVEVSAQHSIAEFIRYSRDNQMELSNLQMVETPDLRTDGIAFLTTVKSRTKRPYNVIMSILQNAPGIQCLEEI